MRYSPAMVAAFLLLLLLLAKGSLLTPPPADGDVFDTQSAVARLARVLGPEGMPHPIDTDEADIIRARLLDEISAMGYTPRVTERWMCKEESARFLNCAFVRNIVFRAGPEGDGALMVSAHYDSVPPGPGAGDAGIGVATLLELASNIQGRALEKPVIFLLNDGEELGLFGAADFVRHDQDRDDVDLVLNLEARGVRGPVMMFETSTPNGAPIDLFRQVPGFKFSNSVMTDLYKILPNDTDVSEYLPAGYRALNMAIVDGVESYHTRADNLENLSRLSVGHMGMLTMGVFDAFMAEGEPKERRLVFTDLWGRVFISAPPALPLIVIVGVMLGSIAVFVRGSGGGMIVAGVAPVAALVVAATAGFVGFRALDLFRDEAAFWTAFPQPAQLLLYVPAIMGASIVMMLAGERTSRERLVAASFFWVALLWFIMTRIIPGSSIMLLIPGLGMIAALIAGSLRPNLFRIATGAAGALSAFLLASLVWQLEVALVYEPAVASSLFAGAFAILAITPLAVRTDVSWFVKAGLVLIGAGFVTGTLLPAHSELRPGHATLRGIQTVSGATYIDATRTDPYVRRHLESLAPFEMLSIEDVSTERYSIEVEVEPLPSAALEVLSEEQTELGRLLRVRMDLQGADSVSLTASDELKITGVGFGGTTYEFDPEKRFGFSCYGRSCDGAVMDIVLVGEGEMNTFNVFNHLPVEMQPLSDQLPRGYGPVHQGEQTFVIGRAQL